jgi:predicted HicB family RNase H-like nuclease
MTRPIVDKRPVTGPIVTKSGAVLTEADIERLADTFEAGIDISRWVRRPVGRPHLEPGADEHSPRIEVRVPPSLHRRVRARAAADGRTVSQVVRRLLEEYVEAG